MHEFKFKVLAGVLALSAFRPLAGLSGADERTEQRRTAAYLSTELLEEVRGRKWDELTPAAPVAIPAAPPDFESYTRTVTVEYLDANLNASAAATGYKRITVCTRTPHISPACLDGLRSQRLKDRG